MKIILLVTIIALICSGAVFAAEEITLSTFYPAPYGEYDELGVDSMAVGSGYAIPAGDGDMVVQGNVGIGTTALGAYQLNVNGTFNCAALSYTGGVLISSDERLKTNIYNLESVSDRIMRLRGVHFNWKDSNRDKEDGLQIGFIAQELEKEFPELVMENNGTMTAYILVRDIYVDLTGAIERASWKGHPQAEIAFNGLVQTRGLSTTEFIQRIFSYDNVPNQLAGIFFASDATGWELSKLKDHDSLYNQEIHFRIVNAGTDYQREEVMFVLRGIPLCCDLVHGQFIFLYPGNPDGTTDHVWLNPGWMDPRDHTQYWVPDCQDVDARR